MSHEWKPLSGACKRCGMLRRFSQSTSKRARDRGAPVRFLEVLPRGATAWKKVPRGHALPPCGGGAKEWITLNEAAARLGISKGSVHHAVSRGAIRSRREMPPPGRPSVVLLLHAGDVSDYKPRNYPRRRASR